MLIYFMENNTECCICLSDINELYDCDRCINKICEECFIKMDKKYDQRNFILKYDCPVCKYEKLLNLDDIDVIKKYKLLIFIKNLINNQNNAIMELKINNNLLKNKLDLFTYYGTQIYKVIKLFYVVDKFVLLTAVTIIYYYNT